MLRIFITLFLTTLMLKKNIKIGIIGLGYVGLPLAIEFGKKFKVIGYDKINLELKI